MAWIEIADGMTWYFRWHELRLPMVWIAIADGMDWLCRW
jgi:hypothetical protein